MTRLLCLLLLAFASSANSPALAQTSTATSIARIDAAMQATYGGEEAGAAILIMRGDQVLLSRGYGLADLEWRQPIGPDTSFRIGSISKPITAVAVLRHVDAGAVDLDAPISTYLPDLPGVLGQPTVRQLLSHTSGLSDHFWLPHVPAVMRNPTTPDELVSWMAETELQFEPGQQWSYSNFNYVLLGRLLERLDPDGRAYGAIIEQDVFAPLGMVNSHYDRQRRIIPRRARGHDHDGEQVTHTITAETSLAYAAGALMSTSDDLVRFTRALRDHRLINPRTREQAWTPTPLADGRTTSYGLGFNVSEFLGETAIWHSGSINGFQASWIHLPGSDLTAAVLSNGYYRPNTTMSARRILADLRGRPVPDFVASDFIEAQWLGLEGQYQLSDGRLLQFHVQDGIRFNIDGDGWAELAVGGDGLLFWPDTLSHMQIDIGPDGLPVGLAYFTSALARYEGQRISSTIDGAQIALPLDLSEAEGLAGTWHMSSGDAVYIHLEEGALSLQLSGQPRQRLYPDATRSYFSRSQPISIRFDAQGDTADLTLWGGTMTLERGG